MRRRLTPHSLAVDILRCKGSSAIFTITLLAIGIGTYTAPASAFMNEDARACMEDGADSAKIIQACTRALESWALSGDERIDVLFKRGYHYGNLKKHAEAVPDYDAVLERYPDWPMARNNRCWSLAALKRYSEAIVDCNHVIRNGSSDSSAYTYALNNRANIYAEMKDFNNTLKDLDLLIKFEPTEANYNWRGRVRDILGLHNAALEDHNKAVELSRNATNLNSRGYLLAQMSRLDEASRDIDAALSLDNSNDHIWDSKAYILLKQKKFDEAIAAYDKALSIQNSSSEPFAEPYAGRAEAKENIGDYIGAKADYQAALRINPDMDWARTGLARVNSIAAGQVSTDSSPLERTSASPPVGPTQSEPDRDLVRKVQSALAALGYKVGAPDGIVGRRTTAALADFKRTYGLIADVPMDEALLSKLNERVAEYKALEAQRKEEQRRTAALERERNTAERWAAEKKLKAEREQQAQADQVRQQAEVAQEQEAREKAAKQEHLKAVAVAEKARIEAIIAGEKERLKAVAAAEAKAKTEQEARRLAEEQAAERARQEAARAEQEKAERERQQALAQEAERAQKEAAERERQQAEAARLKAAQEQDAREKAAAEQARLEAIAAAEAKAEQERLAQAEQERQAAETAAAEKARQEAAGANAASEEQLVEDDFPGELDASDLETDPEPVFPIAAPTTPERVALVIGNSAYRHIPELNNPINDATDIAALLKRLGFTVMDGTNLGRADMEDLMIRYAKAASKAEIALAFYAGHGLQVEGTNYLIPTDAAVEDELDLRRLIRLDDMVRDTGRADRLGLVMVDACRDNPFSVALARSMGKTRSAATMRGLAPPVVQPRMLVAYATAATQTAADGNGRNSPFTEALLKHLAQPEEIRFVFGEVADAVWESSEQRQRPEIWASLGGDRVYLVKPEALAEQLDAELLPSERRAIQEALSKVALYSGNQDGRFSPALRRAIRDYQVRAGAPPTGFLTIQQIVALYDESRYQTAPKLLPQVNIIDLLRRSENKEPAALLLRAKVHDHAYAPGPLPKDMTEAIRFYRMAAEAQDAEAALALGRIYRDGDGVDPDLAQAAMWLKRAAEAGLPEGQYALGELHLEGTGVPEDQEEAVRLFKLAAEKDRAEAIAQLRVLNEWGASN